MARLRITAGGIWKAFYWTLAGAAFWFVYDGVQHPEKFDDKTLPPSAVENRLPGGAFRANLPEVSLNYTGGCRRYRESGHRPGYRAEADMGALGDRSTRARNMDFLRPGVRLRPAGAHA